MLFLAKIAFSHDEKKFSVAKVNNVHKECWLGSVGVALYVQYKGGFVLCPFRLKG